MGSETYVAISRAEDRVVDEGVNWSNLKIDVATEYTVQKKLTIPLRLFGLDKEQRVIPATLKVTALFKGVPSEMGVLNLKYEDSNGKARLNVSNTGTVLQRFRDHKIMGWTLLPSGDAVMHVMPPRPMSSPSPPDSPLQAEDEEAGIETVHSRGRATSLGGGDDRLGGLLEAAAFAFAEASMKSSFREAAGIPQSPSAVGAMPLLADTAAVMSAGIAHRASMGGVERTPFSCTPQDFVPEGSGEVPVTTVTIKPEGGVSLPVESIQQDSTPHRQEAPEGHEAAPVELLAAAQELPWGFQASKNLKESLESTAGLATALQLTEVQGGDAPPSNGVINSVSLNSTPPSTAEASGHWRFPSPSNYSTSKQMVSVSAPIAGFTVSELLAKKPDHHSNAFLTNNNISVPLALFGANANERVLVDRIQLLANVNNNKELFDLGTFRLNCSKSTTSNRMKVSLGSSGTIFKRFPESMWIHGWSKVTDTIMMCYMRVNSSTSSHQQQQQQQQKPLSSVPNVGGNSLDLDNPEVAIRTRATSGTPSSLAGVSSPAASQLPHNTSGNGLLSSATLSALLAQRLAARAPAITTATTSKTAAPSSIQRTPLVTTGGASAAGTSNPSAAATPTGGSCHGLKRPMLPGPGIDALLAAGIALDLSKKARTMEATCAALAAPSQQQKQPAAHSSGLLRSAATATTSGHGLQLQARTKRLLGSTIQGKAPAPAAPEDLELLANIDVEDKPFISTRRQPQAPSITLRPTGLPVLPDLELISTGPAGVVKILLQVIHLLHLPSQLKLGVLKYARGLLSSPGTYGRDFMDVLYTYLQVGCEHGDVGALEYVFSEICGSDSMETLELLHKDLSALQARLDVQIAQESSLPLEQDEGAGGVEESGREGNMHLVSETEAAAMKGHDHHLGVKLRLRSSRAGALPRGLELDLGSSEGQPDPGRAAAAAALQHAAAQTQPSKTGETLNVDIAEDDEESALVSSESSESGIDSEQSRREGLPEGWNVAVDSRTAKCYFWHQETKKVTWDRPTAETPIN